MGSHIHGYDAIVSKLGSVRDHDVENSRPDRKILLRTIEHQEANPPTVIQSVTVLRSSINASVIFPGVSIRTDAAVVFRFTKGKLSAKTEVANNNSRSRLCCTRTNINIAVCLLQNYPHSTSAD